MKSKKDTYLGKNSELQKDTYLEIEVVLIFNLMLAICLMTVVAMDGGISFSSVLSSQEQINVE